eukprot:jgi/Tetstr1/422402/TSEL_013240.t1
MPTEKPVGPGKKGGRGGSASSGRAASAGRGGGGNLAGNTKSAARAPSQPPPGAPKPGSGRSRPASGAPAAPAASKPRSARSGPTRGSGQPAESSAADDGAASAALAALLDGRPEPAGVDWGVEGEEEELAELTDAEVAALLAAEEAAKPTTTLTEDFIAERCVPKPITPEDAAVDPDEWRARGLARITHLRMDRQRLGAAEPAACARMPRLTNVYLQHNRLTAVPDVSRIAGLRFLVAGIRDMPSLMFLDLSHNDIAALDSSELPASLRFLELEGNPCGEGDAGDELVIELMAVLPHLRSVDGMEVDGDDRAAAQTKLFGHVVPAEEREVEGEDEGGSEEEGEGEEEERVEDGAEGGSEDEGAREPGGSASGVAPGLAGRGGDGDGAAVVARAPGGERLGQVLSYLEDIEKGQMAELYALSRASLGDSIANLHLLKQRIAGQMAAGRPAAPGGARPGGTAPSLAPPLAAGRGELEEEAAQLRQMLAELMDPGTDVLRATEAALSSARTGLRAHADGMMDAARRRLGEERERELAVTHEIGDLRRSQAERLLLQPPQAGARPRSAGPRPTTPAPAPAPRPVPAGPGMGARPGSAGPRRPGTPSADKLAAERLYLRLRRRRRRRPG